MKILVAGAGHGGLAAAALLAGAGNSVTVYEKKSRSELGYDWEDRFTFSLIEELTGERIPDDSWRFRGDCAFVSPSYGSSVVIRYSDENRQRIMQRKPLIEMLLSFAQKKGAELIFDSPVSVICDESGVKGLHTPHGDVFADLVIDASGVFSLLRSSLPDKFLIEKKPSTGEVFYVQRAYLSKSGEETTDVPFEVYLCHDREPGLSWCCINDDSVDILIGRINPVSREKFESCAGNFRKKHPCIGNEYVTELSQGTIPVRRPLPVMIAPGYAAVGDSAFMTTPMNGMGIDLSLCAGKILAEEIISRNSCNTGALWNYNVKFIKEYGAPTSRNEGLKNALLKMADSGVDFLFDNGIIQSSDLSGAGADTRLSTLMGKFIRGMRNPAYFFSLLSGLSSGTALKKALLNIPGEYDLKQIEKWLVTVKKAADKSRL